MHTHQDIAIAIAKEAREANTERIRKANIARARKRGGNGAHGAHLEAKGLEIELRNLCTIRVDTGPAYVPPNIYRKAKPANPKVRFNL